MMDNVRIVLVNTTHPGNIGAAARAMKTMGLRRLYLVNPAQFPSAEATARASGADDLLAEATVCRSVTEAIAGCTLVMGTSARQRSLAWPELSVTDAAARAAREPEGHQVALLFGRERYGLTNDELKTCHYLVYIPTHEAYASLNLAQAVQVAAYELSRHADLTRESPEHHPAPADRMEGFDDHREDTLRELGFLDEQSDRLMLRLRRWFNRARPDDDEINILRGILSDTQKAVRGKLEGSGRR
jgi:tRNA (cytidine32/uridine32-2'-O)-methyltransferase